MTIDAALGLLFSVFFFFAIATTAFTIKTEAYLHQALWHTTKEVAHYGYVLSKQSEKIGDNKVVDLINYALTLANGVQQGKQQLELLSPIDDDSVISHTQITRENLLNGVLNMKDNRYVTQALAKYLFKQYIPGSSDTFKDQFLKNMGVLGGLDGISFAGSFLHNDKRSSKISKDNMYITLEIKYRLRGMYYHQFNYHHTIKNSMTLKIRTGEGK